MYPRKALNSSFYICGLNDSLMRVIFGILEINSLVNTNGKQYSETNAIDVGVILHMLRYVYQQMKTATLSMRVSRRDTT